MMGEDIAPWFLLPSWEDSKGIACIDDKAQQCAAYGDGIEGCQLCENSTKELHCSQLIQKAVKIWYEWQHD